MAIRFTRGATAERTRIMVSWELSRDEVGWLIIAAIMPQTYEELGQARTKAELENAIRVQLSARADDRHWWRDEYARDIPGEPTADDIEEWGRRMAALF